MKMFTEESVEAFRDAAPVQSQFTDASEGVWVGGRVYLDEFDDIVFVRCGARRDSIGVERPLRFIGDGLKNVKGFGSRNQEVPGRPEVHLTNSAWRTS